MSIGRRLLVAVALIVALGVPVVALAKPAMAPVVISGDITLTTQGASGGSRMVVKLVERTSSGAYIERAWAEVPVGENALPPFHYTLSTVDSSLLNRPGSTYTVRATIALQTSIRFDDSKTYSAGTNTVSFPIHPSTGYLPYTASGDGWLLLGLILAALAGILAGWRWLRLRPLARQRQLA